MSDERNLDVLWVGDSITQYWHETGHDIWAKEFADKKCKNLGIAGDTTQDVLRRLHTSNLQGLNAKVTVVLIGTNNLSIGVETDDEIASQIEQIVRVIKEKIPATQVILMGVFPREWSPEDPIRERVAAINRRIARLDNRSDIHFLDIGDKLIQPSGEISTDIMSDSLHLTAQGYEVWAENVKPVIEKISQKEPSAKP